MSNDIIRSLYETRVKAYAESQDIPIQFENQPFTPPNNVDPLDNTYLQGVLLPAATTSLYLDGTGKVYSGVFQTNVVIAKGQGVGIGSEFRQAIIDLFPVALQLEDDDFTVQVLTPVSEGPGLVGDTVHITPLSFTYRAYTD